MATPEAIGSWAHVSSENRAMAHTLANSPATDPPL